MWRTDHRSIPPYAVKVVPPECEEVEIYEQLHRLDPASPNHTLPCDIIRLEVEQPFLIMPCLEKVWHDPDRLRWGLLPLLDFFRQVIEVSRLEGCRQLRGFRSTRTGYRISARPTYRPHGR